jgi:hypothetical protein
VDERSLGWPIQKGQPYIPGQNAEALPPKSGKFGINQELASEYPSRFYRYRAGCFGDVTWSGRL